MADILIATPATAAQLYFCPVRDNMLVEKILFWFEFLILSAVRHSRSVAQMHKSQTGKP